MDVEGAGAGMEEPVEFAGLVRLAPKQGLPGVCSGHSASV